MNDNQLAVLRAEDVEFDPVSANVDATPKGRDCILRELA
jgi:hypothetical protein